MKQRFSSLDVKVIAHELSSSLVTLRLANVYDLSTKIFLFKFAKPDNKKQFIIDSGFRCHLTEFARATAASPSPFVAKLRKFLKTRRVTKISQIGTDRIIEIEFTNYRLFLEFYAGGNIILTDSELNILALLRIVPEGQGEEEQRVGLKYILESRQNFGGTPPLTRDRLEMALRRSVEKVEQSPAAAKKYQKNSRDALRKALAVSITEFPPILVDHAMRVTSFDPSVKPGEILQNQGLLEHLLRSLEEAQRVVHELTSAKSVKGYIIAKARRNEEVTTENDASMEIPATQRLLYEDFHPFRPRQFEEDPNCKLLSFKGFNQTVDEFFSSIEGQRLESRLNERESNAKKKLEAAKQDQARRLGGLQEIQDLNIRQANAIQANVERIQEAMNAVNGLIAKGMDWFAIGALIEQEQRRHNPVAEILKLPLKLEENTVTMMIGEEELSGDEGYETDTGFSDSENEDLIKTAAEKPESNYIEVDINLGISPWANAREYHEQKRSAAIKEQKTLQSSSKALKSTEHKIALDLTKGLKLEKALLRPVRAPMWFEKFAWFISSDGLMVLGGRDAQQSEILYKKYLGKNDVLVHADIQGAQTVVVRNNTATADSPIPPSTLTQAGTLAVVSSDAWDSKAGMSAWWAASSQASKTGPTGDLLPVGSFNIAESKNFLPPAQLLLGFGILFRISDESKRNHTKHRLNEGAPSTQSEIQEPLDGTLSHEDAQQLQGQSTSNPDIDHDPEIEEHESEEGFSDSEDVTNHVNPLLSTLGGSVPETFEDNDVNETNEVELMQNSAGAHNIHAQSLVDGRAEDLSEDEMPRASSTATPSIAGTFPGKKSSNALPRGKRGKAKKVATKYKDQDDEDRLAAQSLIGATLGREKAEAAMKAKAQRDAEAALQRNRRRAQHERTQNEVAKHEEARKKMLNDGVDVIEDDSAKLVSLDTLVGTPLPGDEILDAIPVCAPWEAMKKVKYKAKLQPGPQKKGKAVKDIFAKWTGEMNIKAKVDQEARDTERMWPKEMDLIRALKPEECINIVPVGKVRVMMAGGSGGSGSKVPQNKASNGKGKKPR